MLDVFRQIADAPVVEDHHHHYDVIMQDLEIAGSECRRVIRRRGARVTRGTTQYIDMEIATDVPLDSRATQRWIGIDLITRHRLRVEVANEPNAYRKVCRVWLEQPLNRDQPFDIQLEAIAPITEIDGFGCAGVKLRGFRKGVDKVDVRFDFLDPPLSLNGFELQGRTVSFSTIPIEPSAPKNGFVAAYRVQIAQPPLRQLLFAWFREPSEAIQPTLNQRKNFMMRILFIAANPATTKPLDLEEEIRSLEGELRSVTHAEAIKLNCGVAARPDDIIRLVRAFEPTIIHFSGHGSAQGIQMRADDGGYHSVTGPSLKRFLTGRGVDLVVLNACYSKPQADAIGSAVGAVVGTTGDVDDEAARRFTVAFYRSLGNGLSIRESFRDGSDAVSLYNFDDVFHCSGGLDHVLLRRNQS